ncbi:hypothetical protein F4824DRAFT_507996 [Ustulina deusta]|nr:hypothetical protein F4824DRAFT_507996 [Ustulina deusta]
MPTLHPNHISAGYLNYDIISGILTLVSTICDDWTILIALILAIGVFITNVLIAIPSIGAAGHYIDTYTVAQLSVWAKLGLAADVLYNVSVALSKMSVLLFFRRIFSVDTPFLIPTRVIFFFIIGVTFSSVFGLIFSDNPVQAQWDFTLPRTTITTKPFYIISAVVNILLGTAILVFLIGRLTIISSILRIVYLEAIDLDDPTCTLTTPGIWTDAEMFLFIICAFLPVIYSLFRSLFLRKRSTSHNLSTGANKSTGPLISLSKTSMAF